MRHRRRLLALVGAVCLAAGGAAVASASAAKAPHRHLPEPNPLLRELVSFRVRYIDLLNRHAELVRTVRVGYRASDGSTRYALVILPYWYGPKQHPVIPLVISPHGRGAPPSVNAQYWGGLPAFGPFVVVNPEGQGRRLALYSWGWRGQIDDLARMPDVLEKALPWLHVDRKRIYAVGSSMGGQETLLLVALHPHLLAGAAALDSATNMAARYQAFKQLPDGDQLRQFARIEIGGTPAEYPRAYALRSPQHWAPAIAASGVPLHIWWSTRDRIVRNQRQESGLLYRTIRGLDRDAPVSEYVGSWKHSLEFEAIAKLPLALLELKLIALDEPKPKDTTVKRTPGGKS